MSGSPGRSAGAGGRTEDARWRAVLGRDPRADGCFVYAVRTTGIYCRPVCPARRPHRRNVLFFESGLAAADRGYRACKLCRPDAGDTVAKRDLVSIRPAAVLFADVKGFAKLASTMSPEAALALAVTLERRLAGAVLTHRGVVHKLLGDGLMAVFGALRSCPSDAARALDAALAMQMSVGAWNAARAARGAPAIEIGVGVHFGPVAFGAGAAGPAIAGDTVNVASRLERATRRLHTSIVASDESLRALDDRDAGRLRPAFASAGPVRLRGCHSRPVWVARSAVDARRAA